MKKIHIRGRDGFHIGDRIYLGCTEEEAKAKHKRHMEDIDRRNKMIAAGNKIPSVRRDIESAKKCLKEAEQNLIEKYGKPTYRVPAKTVNIGLIKRGKKK